MGYWKNNENWDCIFQQILLYDIFHYLAKLKYIPKMVYCNYSCTQEATTNESPRTGKNSWHFIHCFVGYHALYIPKYNTNFWIVLDRINFTALHEIILSMLLIFGLGFAIPTFLSWLLTVLFLKMSCFSLATAYGRTMTHRMSSLGNESIIFNEITRYL